MDKLIAAIAVSLYQYNVNSFERADKLYQHFDGDCYDLFTLTQLVDNKNWATEMPLPTAKVYLAHAIEKYGEEATMRYQINDIN